MTEDTRALITASNGGSTALVAEATAMAQAMAEFLPGGAAVPEATRKAMALLAVHHGLDPFLGEVYAIPQRRQNDRGQWETTGYTLGIGRGGWLRNAERSGLYRGHCFRSLNADETKGLKVGPNDLGTCCIVYKVTDRTHGQSRAYQVEGFGVVKSDEKSKMDHFKLARKRAFVDALRNAFPMQVPTMNGQQMDVRIIDEDTGEILGNGHEPHIQTPPTEPPASIEADLAEFSEAPAPKIADDLPWPDAEVTPVPAPEARPRSRGDLMNELQALAMEYYPQAPGIALNNHLKRDCGGKTIGMLSMDELQEQIGVFKQRLAEKQEVAA